MGGRAAALAALAWLAGCDHVIVDHTASLSLDDAGARHDAAAHLDAAPDASATTDDCEGEDDGTPCDDHDVCSPSSMCQGGACVGGTAFDTCVVADTLTEFGDTQGEHGWYYGYWNASADADGSYQHDTDFAPMEYCGDSTWLPPGRCDIPEDDPAHRWTRVLDWALMHPETRPDTELPIRRWISDVSGPARVSLEHWLSGSTGDGTRALLVIDGVEVWRHDAPAGDHEGIRDAIDVELSEGTVVDQILHPIGTSADDMTHFAIVIEGP